MVKYCAKKRYKRIIEEKTRRWEKLYFPNFMEEEALPFVVRCFKAWLRLAEIA